MRRSQTVTNFRRLRREEKKSIYQDSEDFFLSPFHYKRNVKWISVIYDGVYLFLPNWCVALKISLFFRCQQDLAIKIRLKCFHLMNLSGAFVHLFFRASPVESMFWILLRVHHSLSNRRKCVFFSAAFVLMKTIILFISLLFSLMSPKTKRATKP